METFTLLLAPMAPHLAEELWEILGHDQTLAYAPWPTFDPALLKDDEIEVPVQINGKLRARISVPADADQEQLEAAARADEKIIALIDGKPIRKTIVVPGQAGQFRDLIAVRCRRKKIHSDNWQPRIDNFSLSRGPLDQGDLVARRVVPDLVHEGPDQEHPPAADPHQVFGVDWPVEAGGVEAGPFVLDRCRWPSRGRAGPRRGCGGRGRAPRSCGDWPGCRTRARLPAGGRS